MSENEVELMMLDAMLDTDIDSIEDLPEFATIPRGAYMVSGTSVKPQEAEGERSAGVMLIMQVEQTLELENEGDEPPKEGTLISSTFVGEFGMKKLKQVFLPVMQGLGCSTIREFVDQFEGLQMAIVNSHRKDKNDKSIIYNDVRNAVLPGGASE